MAWPKGKPRKVNTETEEATMDANHEPVGRAVTLMEANADARRTSLALAAKRDACIAEMLKPYLAAYGPDKAPHVRRFLRDLIDGKPVTKPKPIRMLPGGLRNGATPTA
jgi:hypothetical protein